jgi:hypothetical protein
MFDAVIPGWSGGPDPESRDSGFGASHRPGMTNKPYIVAELTSPASGHHPNSPIHGHGFAISPRLRASFTLNVLP